MVLLAGDDRVKRVWFQEVLSFNGRFVDAANLLGEVVQSGAHVLSRYVRQHYRPRGRRIPVRSDRLLVSPRASHRGRLDGKIEQTASYAGVRAVGDEIDGAVGGRRLDGD